jgi:Rad3-related DNA helicase
MNRDYDIYFPKKPCYPNQREAMDDIYQALIKKQADIKVIVLKGKKLMCPKPDIDYDTCRSLMDKTYKLLEQERDLPVNHAVFIDNQKNRRLEHETEEAIDDLKNKYCEYLEWASSNNSCGYELLKKYMKEADLLICNYNHFLDEGIRGNVLGWMNKDLKDIIAVFDEAHNIESAARKHSSTTLTEQTVMQALDEIKTNTNPLFSWDDDYGRLELFTCIPKNVTAPLFNSLHAGVLMSATLAPFDAMERTLGITRETCELAFGLTFPKENRLTIAVSVPPLFAKDRDDQKTKEIITKVLSDIIEQSDGNVLIFFPSFDEAKQYKKRLKCNLPVFLDEKGVCAQTIKDEFFKLGEKDKKAVLLSYMWGTLTEGVDYKDRRGRTVVIVGVGYPALNDRTRAVEAAYEAEFGHGWDYAIEIPTIRKVRQALGRVVRSPDDYGVRVLLDSRYSSSSVKHLGKYSVFNIFPEEERAEIIDVKPENVKYSILNFFNERKKEKQMMQTENEKLKRQIEYLESDNKNRENKIKESDYELTEIEKLIGDDLL